MFGRLSGSAKQMIVILTVVFAAASAIPILRPLAQTTSGRITGTVRDRASKGVPDAKVEFVNEETKRPRATRTDGAESTAGQEINNAGRVTP